MADNRRAEAWKAVYERMLDCESVHSIREKEATKGLAKALALAHKLDEEENAN